MVCRVGCCMSRNSRPMLLMFVRATAVRFCSTGRPSSSPIPDVLLRLGTGTRGVVVA